jgi:hypothetical protein
MTNNTNTTTQTPREQVLAWMAESLANARRWNQPTEQLEQRMLGLLQSETLEQFLATLPTSNT